MFESCGYDEFISKLLNSRSKGGEKREKNRVPFRFDAVPESSEIKITQVKDSPCKMKHITDVDRHPTDVVRT